MAQKLGKYELVRKLGEGASSTVYLARDPFAQRDVAIKVGTPEILNNPRKGRIYTNLFLNEASLVGKLNHPHIVQIYDAVVAEKICYIVMEYVAGGTLENHAHPGQLLPLDRVVELVFKCTRALEFAHRLGITHRDIKPANILLAGGTNIKISDFGAAITGQNERTQISGIGSPSYMSPEQVMELPLDHRTDIYSLGVVLFQLLTGRLPFEADNQFNIVYQIVHNEAPKPSSLREGIPAALDDIVARAMAKDREQRYQTWGAFAQDLAHTVRKRLLHARRGDFLESEKFGILRALPFFADFSDVEIWEVLGFSHWQRVAPGTVILHDGAQGDAFCFLADGQLKVSKGGKPLNVLCKGDCFGEMAVLNRHASKRNADVTAITESDIVTVRGEALQQASEACRMHFYQGFVEVLVNRLNLANQRLASN
ncbi:MAG: serine/threonine protein kinase [Betaproteobacteria bacterium HGW-Betaproteobacteria-12]|nr:MAG: serine/threonine protein kinase [Betaproteobacteria bacterium HGW-Betaproteobacteria-12]